ncbi:MAG: hypothetical protein ACLPSW_12840 [Roseiarcus sp.]
MPWSLSLPARKNGRRLAQDSSAETGEFDPHRVSAYCAENFEPEEIRCLIQMLQGHLDKPQAEDLESPSQRRDRILAGDSRRGPDKEYFERFPNARRLKA